MLPESLNLESRLPDGLPESPFACIAQLTYKFSLATLLCNKLSQACECIPSGKVATYGVLSGVLGSSARAVGQVG